MKGQAGCSFRHENSWCAINIGRPYTCTFLKYKYIPSLHCLMGKEESNLHLQGQP